MKKITKNSCSISEADKEANAQLTVPQFDYLPSTPQTARALADRGCHSEAADAAQDYLVRRQIEDERSHSNVIFHMGQNLAMAGDEKSASMMIAAAKRTTQLENASFDWNTYVVGTWAFLKRDRTLLQQSYDKLRSQPGEGNTTNANVLSGLLHCFNLPYSEAYSPKCIDNARNASIL